MKPVRIAKLYDSDSALAIPFGGNGERYVVLARIARRRLKPDEVAVLDALEGITVPAVCEPVRASGTQATLWLEPTIVTYNLSSNLYDIVEKLVVDERGWPLLSARRRDTLRALLETRNVDVLLVDTSTMDEPRAHLTGIHRLMELTADCRILAFGTHDAHDLLKETLVDALLPAGATPGEVLAALKDLTRTLPELRRKRVAARSEGLRLALRSANSYRELAATGTELASVLMGGWACIDLVSEDGSTYHCERPKLGTRVLSRIPKAFLNDAPFYQFRADEQFYDELSDDAGDRAALASLQPASAAVMPLISRTKRFGSLVAVASPNPVDTPVFEALESLSHAMVQRFDEISRGVVVSARPTRLGDFDSLRTDACDLLVYRSEDCTQPWRYRSLAERLGLLEIGCDIGFAWREKLAAGIDGDRTILSAILDETVSTGPRFIAAVDGRNGSITYAADGFPPPTILDARGPRAVYGEKGGTVVLASNLLVCDASVRNALASIEPTSEAVEAALAERRPGGFAVLFKTG